MVIAKDKKIGYLAQYQDIHGHHTIYEELMTTKQYILDMEDKIRSLEQEMKYVAGDKLESLMNSYTRLTHQFELENGYAYKSEIVGVLKGLGFEEEDYGKQIENLSAVPPNSGFVESQPNTFSFFVSEERGKIPSFFSNTIPSSATF